MSDFTNVDPAVGILFEAVGPQTVDGGTPFSFLATDIGFNNPVAGGGLVPDGGFEAAGAAGLQPPWFVFENGGTVSVSDITSNGGTYAARLQADASSGAASFPILKVERLGAGSLTNGGPVTVSFDAIDVDNVGVGKVFVAEFFTERSDPPGGATNEVLMGGYGLSGVWQTYSFNTNLGADAAGGVSLLFKADCGANPACTMDVFIDNVGNDNADIQLSSRNQIQYKSSRYGGIKLLQTHDETRQLVCSFYRYPRSRGLWPGQRSTVVP
jgi:hypothetical protein